MGHLLLKGLFTNRLPVFQWKAKGYDWSLVDSIGQPSLCYDSPEFFSVVGKSPSENKPLSLKNDSY